MRMNKEMARLTEEAKAVQWPQKPHQTFTSFREALRVVLDANDISARGLAFDEYEGDFYWTEQFSARIGGHPGVFEHTFYIDPKLPIADEIVRVLREREEIREGLINIERERYAREQIQKAKAGNGS